jgi:tetratricopeptide (TPR) repeat protein
MGNRPGVNRPITGGGSGIGNIGSGNIGSGNTIGSGNNIVNRPNFGGNTINNISNISGGNRIAVGGNNNAFVNNRNNWGAGNWGGGNWGGGGWGGGWGGGGWGVGGWGGGWGAGGWGGGAWNRPYYGNWYRGGWGASGFWTGFGVGALTTFGLGALGSVLSYPAYSYSSTIAYPVESYGVYDYFPTWGASNYASWGLGSVASSSLYADYTNPYYAQGVAAQPPQTTVAYDYSQPINAAATPPDASVTTTTEQVFSEARDAFKAGDYARALAKADQVLQQTPNASVVHEFRALSLFALKRYDEAASVIYAVLTSGPGWNWSTMVGLYPDVDTYTSQLRALEAYDKSNLNSATGAFLLAYHYMVQDHPAEAASQFERVVQLQPKDQLSASFAKVLKKATEPQGQPAPAGPAQPQAQANAGAPQGQPAPAGPAQPQAHANAGAPSAEEAPPPPPPPAALTGTWKANPSADVAITLTLNQDGAFTWVVDTKGDKQTLEGTAGFKDNTLALLQADGPPLVGKVTQGEANSFEFRPPNAPAQAPGLKFSR